MQYQNPKLPDNVNVSRNHPLKTFLKLLAMAAVLAIIVILSLSIFAQFAAKAIPFSFETAIAEHFTTSETEKKQKLSVPQFYLQDLADKILAQSDAPEQMKIKVHYSNENVINAFATLGGNVYFYKGLVERLKSEQALAMVMAHEIAHIVNRDPITALGRGLSTAIALSAIFESPNNALIRRFIGGGEILTSLKYSRDHERNADADGYDWVYKLYGHTCGAEELFELFESLNSDDEANPPEILTTHPYASKRLQAIRQKQKDACEGSDSKIIPNPLHKKG